MAWGMTERGGSPASDTFIFKENECIKLDVPYRL